MKILEICVSTFWRTYTCTSRQNAVSPHKARSFAPLGKNSNPTMVGAHPVDYQEKVQDHGSYPMLLLGYPITDSVGIAWRP